MARDIKTIPNASLETAQRAIDFASREMHGFFQHVQKEGKEGKVSQSYVDKLEASLHSHVEKNNKIIDAIDKELFSRVRKIFPEATTPDIMNRLVKQYEKEVDDYKELLSTKEKPKGKLNLVSNETIKE